LRVEVNQIFVVWVNLFKSVQEYENIEASEDNLLIELNQVSKFTEFVFFTHILALGQSVLFVMIAFLYKLNEV